MSVPLGLVETVTDYNKQICWPRAQTSRRQAHSATVPGQEQPLDHLRCPPTNRECVYIHVQTHTHMHKGKSAFSTDCLSMQPILVPFFFYRRGKWPAAQQKKKVKVGFNSTLIFINRGIFCLEKIHPHSTARKLIKRKEKEKREKCLSLQISGF